MERYRKLVNYYKNRYDEYQISIQRTGMSSKFNGYCFQQRGKFYIRIHRELEEEAAISILIHEIAHVLSWHVKEDHGFGWGRAYSKAYRDFLEWTKLTKS